MIKEEVVVTAAAGRHCQRTGDLHVGEPNMQGRR